jgi:hypothetical protein
VIKPPGGLAAGPFFTGEQVLVVADDGRSVLSVRAADGDLAEARTLAHRPERVRLVGKAPGGMWLVQGQRTFSFVPETGAGEWSVQTVGRLEVPPAIASGTALLVDQTGGCYGVDLASGEVKWRRTLSFPPIQPPYATTVGFVVTTLGGEAVAMDPGSGEARAVVPPDPTSPTFLAPWREGLAILGGGAPGFAMLSPARERSEVGTAAPDFAVRPTPAQGGLAWVEKDGRVRWMAKDATKAVRLDALGTPALPVAIDAESAYAVGKDGVLRAVRLETPRSTTWSARLPAPARGEPVVFGDKVLVATDAGLCAFDR